MTAKADGTLAELAGNRYKRTIKKCIDCGCLIPLTGGRLRCRPCGDNKRQELRRQYEKNRIRVR